MTTKPVDFSVAPVTAARAFAHAAANPFLTDASDVGVADDAPEGSYTYAIVQSAPALAADEVETAAEAVEVMVRFGTTVLHVAHLSPPRPFWLGEANADVVVPEEKLGATRLPIVLTDAAGAPRLMVPASARGWIQAPGQMSTKVSGAAEVAITTGLKAELEIGGVTISVGGVLAGKKIAGRLAVDTKALPAQGISLLVHGAILAATALFMPPLAMADEGGVDQDQQLLMRTALDAAAVRDQPDSEEPGKDASALENPQRRRQRPARRPAARGQDGI